MPYKECAQQRADMQSVRIGVGENADLVVAQSLKVAAVRLKSDCHRNGPDFL